MKSCNNWNADHQCYLKDGHPGSHECGNCLQTWENPPPPAPPMCRNRHVTSDSLPHLCGRTPGHDGHHVCVKIGCKEQWSNFAPQEVGQLRLLKTCSKCGNSDEETLTVTIAYQGDGGAIEVD